MREGASGAGVAHLEECRERLERAMRATGDVRITEAEARVAALVCSSFFVLVATLQL